MNYQEDTALDQYITTHFRNLMTPMERVILAALENVPQHRHDSIVTHWGPLRSDRIEQALNLGKNDYITKVRKRIMSQHSVMIQRCKQCGRITRTPKSKQCAWCLHDWHCKQQQIH